MSGSWAQARAALASRLNGLQVTPSGLSQETLRGFEYSPSGRQDVVNWPYAFVLPRGRTVRREPGDQRITVVEAVARIMLAPPAQTVNLEQLQRRYEAWCDRLSDAFDGAVSLGAAVDIFLDQTFEGLARFDDVDTGWGFDMALGDLECSETKAFSP